MAERKSIMTKVIASLIVCAAMAAPTVASAQQNDAAYCAALGKKYESYIGDSTAAHKGQQRDSKVDVAISKCSTDTAGSIGVLEKALKDAKVDLPPRG
jgi:hypothetical protein